MNQLVAFSRIGVAFVAASGFLFGQIFFGRFEILATVIGVSGLALAALGPGATGGSTVRAGLILCFALVTLAGVSVDAYDYYSSTPSWSGTYYPWILVGPYVVAVLFIVGLTVRNLWRTAGR